jgi:signal transduction histidine kinase
MEELTGVSRKDSIGKRVFDVLPFVSEIGESRCYRAALEGKSVSTCDRPYWIASTNRRGFFEARYTPIRAETGKVEGNGRVIGGLVMMRDITERRRSEESLRTLSARLLRIQDDERRRIARELHDGTSQTLTGIKLNLGGLRRMGFEGEAAALLADTIAMTDRALQEIRTTSYLLHPTELDLIGLAGAVRSYTRGFSERTGIRAEVEISRGLERLPQDIETALFRIVQESLANVHRHSQSRSAKVKLVRNSHSVIEEIRDFGRGMALADAAASSDAAPGVGIAGMRARVRQLNGEIQIDSSGRGTVVRVNIPVAPTESHVGLSGGG